MASESSSSASAGPKSWAEDLNSYRSARGSQSYATLDQTATPRRYCRTNLVPFGDTRHPLFAYNDFTDGRGKIKPDVQIQADRHARHGWGDVSLTKEADPSTFSATTTHHTSKGIPKQQPAPDGRTNLFGVLQMTDAGAHDSWVGNPLIACGKGKKPVTPPPDPKGRKDLFDVLHERNPGVPSDDSWIGNGLIDPAKGKAPVPSPEQMRGRKDLTTIFTQSILDHPDRLKLLQKGADPLGDAWCGHPLIQPSTGKKAVEGIAAAQDIMQGGTFKVQPPADWTDFPNRHTKAVPPPVPTLAKDIILQKISGDDWGHLGRKPAPEPSANPFDGHKDLYAHMTFKALTDKEHTWYRKAFDDAKSTGKRVVPIPGKDEATQGLDMLHWKPEMRRAYFVPAGGLMQENRKHSGRNGHKRPGSTSTSNLHQTL